MQGDRARSDSRPYCLCSMKSKLPTQPCSVGVGKYSLIRHVEFHRILVPIVDIGTELPRQSGRLLQSQLVLIPNRSRARINPLQAYLTALISWKRHCYLKPTDLTSRSETRSVKQLLRMTSTSGEATSYILRCARFPWLPRY